MSTPAELTNDALAAAYDTGEQAGLDGEHVRVCPYDAGSIPATLWLRGYTAGRIARAKAG